jgi:tight adherence protein B
VSGAATVVAAWELIGALQTAGARRSMGAVAAPLRAAAAGREPTKIERRRLALVAGVTLLFAGYLLSGLAFALGLAVLGPVVLAQILRVSRERWRADVAGGAPAAARAIADALSGGHSLPMAIAAAGQQGAVAGGAGRELRTVAGALSLGADQDELLKDLAGRVRDPSWDALAAAIALQRRAGGDLAGLLRRIADVADERDRVDADARGLTAQARFTARIVAAMPVAGLALAAVVAPGGLSAVVSNPVSFALLCVAALILVAALVAIGRIARPLR